MLKLTKTMWADMKLESQEVILCVFHDVTHNQRRDMLGLVYSALT